jgi:HAD superfamily hydrolase (TIGR01509 family)
MKEENPFLLFDLGGVLVELAGGVVFLEWLDDEVTLEVFHNRWLHSHAVRLYESGKITQKEFAQRAIAEFGFKADEAQFTDALYHFPKAPYKGIIPLLEDLNTTYDIGCLSNTNASHWERMCNEFRLDRLLPVCLLSYKTGLMKPDAEAFLHAASVIGRPPSEIIYFDDNTANVREAAKIGFSAHCVTGGVLKAKLRELHLI